MSRLWFTSDWHFNHGNILSFCPDFRPYAGVGEMNEAMIALWNECVSPKDTVYNLGDVFFGSKAEKALPVLRRLNGRHHLILGNHDHFLSGSNVRADLLQMTKNDGNPLFSTIRHYAEIHHEKQRIILSHYPMGEWNGMARGAWMLHGHIHNAMTPIPGRILNVGWDLHGRLLAFEDVADFLNPLPVRRHNPKHKEVGRLTDVGVKADFIRQHLQRHNPDTQAGGM